MRGAASSPGGASQAGSIAAAAIATSRKRDLISTPHETATRAPGFRENQPASPFHPGLTFAGATRTPANQSTRTRLPEPRIKFPGLRTKLPGPRIKFPGLRTKLPGPRTKFPGSRIKLPGLRTTLPGPRTEFPGPRTKLENPRTKLENPRTRLENPRTRLENPRTKLKNPRTKLKNPRTKLTDKLEDQVHESEDQAQEAEDQVHTPEDQAHTLEGQTHEAEDKVHESEDQVDELQGPGSQAPRTEAPGPGRHGRRPMKRLASPRTLLADGGRRATASGWPRGGDDCSPEKIASKSCHPPLRERPGRHNIAPAVPGLSSGAVFHLQRGPGSAAGRTVREDGIPGIHEEEDAYRPSGGTRCSSSGTPHDREEV